MKKVAIIGAGAYSLALSRILDRNGAEVTIFTTLEAEKELLYRERKNERILPGVRIGERTVVSTNPEESFKDSEIIVIALPSDVVRPVIMDLAQSFNNQVVCLTTKGIEAESGMLMHDVLGTFSDTSKLCALSGPSFALEIANYKPTIVTAAGSNENTELLRQYFENDTFKIEQTTDLVGVLACGAFKNIYAIGAGILAAKKAGSNALSSLITRGFNEMSVICEALGGSEDTMTLACGIGDLVTTCTGELSRNRQFGILVGQGGEADARAGVQIATIEGYTALVGAKRIVDDKQLDLPIIQAIYGIVNDNQPPELLLKAICK